MASDAPKNRKWERYGCLLPCRITRHLHTDTPIAGRIINIGRGGLLIEVDHDFIPGDQVTISAQLATEIERFECAAEIRGTVRWGQIDSSSLMGLYYVGVEFEELLPLKKAIDGFS